MTRSGQAVIGAMLLLAGAVAAHAQGGERAREPWELVRSLRMLQDEIARGSAEAHRVRRDKMDAISAEIAAVDKRHWKEPRNQRAAVLYVVSGGDPRVLRDLLAARGLSGDVETLARGVLAYAEGRMRLAAQHLSGIEARHLAPEIAGSIALIQAMASADGDAGKALQLLEVARLVSPGTLVEEAALRRQILLLPAAGRNEMLEPLLSRYVRRFGNSYYAGAFWHQLAALITGLETLDERERLARFEGTIASLSGEARRQLYLAIAQESIARGRVSLARFAAARASQLANAGTNEALGAQLYEGAALIVTDEYERGLAKLTAISSEKLPPAEAGLLGAALRLARLIRRLPDPDLQMSAPTVGNAAERARELSAIGLAVIARAKTVLAGADAVLSGGKQ